MKRLDAEFLLPLPLVVLHGLIYNAVGELAGRRGVDFGPVLFTPLDAAVPFVPLMVIPYTLAWVFPLLLLVAILTRREIGAPAVRRVVVAVVALELLCYALWLAFPVKVSHRVALGDLAAHGWLGELVAFNYRWATEWNACPSFHNAGPWLFLRAAHHYGVHFRAAFLAFFVAIALSTVMVRIHFVADIVVGIAAGELAFRAVLLRLERSGALGDHLPRAHALRGYLVLLGASAAALALLKVA